MHAKARWIMCSSVVFRRVPTARLCSYEGWIVEERSTCLAVPSRLPCPYDVSLVSERCLYPMQQRAGTRAEGRLVTSERTVFSLRQVSLTCLKASFLTLGEPEGCAIARPLTVAWSVRGGTVGPGWPTSSTCQAPWPTAKRARDAVRNAKALALRIVADSVPRELRDCTPSPSQAPRHVTGQRSGRESGGRVSPEAPPWRS